MFQNILAYRRIFFAVSGIFFIFSVGMLLFSKLNLGIDMTGGAQMEFAYTEYQYDSEKILEEAETVKGHINLQKEVISSVGVYKISGESSFVVEAGFTRNLSESEIETWKIAYKDQLEDYYSELGDITLMKYTNIGASFGDYIKKTAVLTLILAVLAIAGYIAYAFSGSISGITSLSFAFITIITLFHDVIISTGLYIMTSLFFPQFQIDTFFVTALLTILGYSINDTIVIFDRIRSNLRVYGGKGKNLLEIVTTSLSESFTRSMYTSLTLVFVLVAILLFGPDSIKGFTLAMLFGTIVGTFSSICIAAPMLYEFHKNTILKPYIKREHLSNDDKMVV